MSITFTEYKPYLSSKTLPLISIVLPSPSEILKIANARLAIANTITIL